MIDDSGIKKEIKGIETHWYALGIVFVLIVYIVLRICGVLQ